MNLGPLSKNPIPTPQPHPYPRLGSLDLIKTLNSGSTSKVKLAQDPQTKAEYAVKIIKPEFQERYLSTYEQEAKFLLLINMEKHSNIVKLIECRPKADYIKKNGTIKKVYALVFEYAKGGDLFECIKAFGDFQEDIARTYFQQLMSTVDYLHQKGIIHGDLKLENLLLDENFSLKIADFSFASFAFDGATTPIQRQRLGTLNYMSPEFLANASSVGQMNDIFACGVILFIMVVGSPPFEKASIQDIRYKLIIKQQFAMFWKSFEARGRTFSDNFKSLLNSMFAYEPTERLSFSEIVSHSWYKDKICLIEDLKTEYDAKRHEFEKHQEEKTKQMQKMKELKASKKKELDQKLAKFASFSMKGIVPLGKHRSLGGESSPANQEEESQRVKRKYIYTGFRRFSELFYDVSQETMFKLLLLFSEKLFNEYKVHSEEYKIKGRVISDGDEFNGELLIEISSVNEDSCCISFTKIRGDLAPFYKLIEERIQTSIDSFLERLEESDA